MLYLILLHLIMHAQAETDARTSVDKTYARDNTFCKMNGKQVEFQLRGVNRYTDPGEERSGELAFYKIGTGPFLPLMLGKDTSGTYRLFKQKSASLCSKSLGVKLDQEHLAVLFQKENRPYKSKLMVQIFDMKNMQPKYLQETEIEATQIEPITPFGFAFNSTPARNEMDSGKVVINEIPYQYQDRSLVLWYKYAQNGFKLLPILVFEKFPWQHLFKDQPAFLAVAGWDKAAEKFVNTTVYVAVNHNLKKECVLLLPEKSKLTGSEAWVCGDMKSPVD
jgi:hypothetical protein